MSNLCIFVNLCFESRQWGNAETVGSHCSSLKARTRSVLMPLISKKHAWILSSFALEQMNGWDIGSPWRRRLTTDMLHMWKFPKHFPTHCPRSEAELVSFSPLWTLKESWLYFFYSWNQISPVGDGRAFTGVYISNSLKRLKEKFLKAELSVMLGKCHLIVTELILVSVGWGLFATSPYVPNLISKRN